MSESIEERRRKEVIDKILTFPANTYKRAFLDEPHPRTGRRYSISELESYHEQLQSTVSVEDQIVRVQAEIYAERTLHQLRMQQAQEPQRRADQAKRLAKDKETFAALCRQHGLSECEANLNLWRGSQSIEGLVQASPEELVKFQQERIEAHNEFLLNADTETLRTLAREEHAVKRQAAVQTEADLQLAASKARDAIMGGFPALPDTWNGQKLDSEFIRRCSAETQKLLQERFGSAQLTARLQGHG